MGSSELIRTGPSIVHCLRVLEHSTGSRSVFIFLEEGNGVNLVPIHTDDEDDDYDDERERKRLCAMSVFEHIYKCAGLLVCELDYYWSHF